MPWSQTRQVGAYLSANGQSPFKTWVLGLKDALTQATIYRRLDRVSAGNLGDHKKVGEIFETRIDLGPGYRIYFGQDGPKLVVLLAGGDKSTQEADIKVAEGYWHDYQTRKAKALAPL